MGEASVNRFMIPEPDWLRFGEARDLAASKGVSRKVFLKLLQAKETDPADKKREVFVIERRVFDGCVRLHYGRASLMKLLQSERKP